MIFKTAQSVSLMPCPLVAASTPLQIANESLKSQGKAKKGGAKQPTNTVSRKNSVTHNGRHLKQIAKACSTVGRRDLQANALARYSKALLNINKPVAAAASLRGKRGPGVAPGVSSLVTHHGWYPTSHFLHFKPFTSHLASHNSQLSTHPVLPLTLRTLLFPPPPHILITFLLETHPPPQAALLLFSPPLPREACCVLRRYFILKNKDKRDAQTLPLALLFFSIILHHEAYCVLHHHIKATSTLSTTPPAPFQPRQAQFESKRFIAQESLYTATSDGACLLQSVTTLHQFHHHLPY